MSDWYIYNEGREEGPFDFEALVAYLGTVKRTQIYIRRDRLDGWKLPQDVPEFAGFIGSSPPKHDTVPIAPEITVELRYLHKTSAPKMRKYSWARIGAVIGIVACFVDVISEWRGQILQPLDAYGLGYNFGYIFGCVGFLALIGFILGAIRDAVTTRSGEVTSQPIQRTFDSRVRFNNIIARHWRGELPLWISYWIFGFVGNITVALIPIAAIAIFKTNKGYHPLSILFASTVVWGGVLAVAVWQMVGVWRSATRYNEVRVKVGERALWGRVAKVVVVLGVVQLVGVVAGKALPQLSEMYRIAFYDDPEIPAYYIRVMRDGTEVEIVGGFKYGLTNDFMTIAKANPQIKVVHLDSIGGRLGEGESLFKYIRERGLDTYVSSKCLSACTLAFAGGRQRFILKGAILGFHKGSFPGLGEGEFDVIQKDVFKTAGFKSDFVTRALSTPHKDMWQPDSATLLGANVVTRITDGNTFAASGFGGNLTKEKIATDLVKVPIFRTIRVKFPDQFDAMVDQYLESILKGKTQQETLEILRSKLLPFLISLIPQADDDVLIDYNRVLIDQYSFLSTKNASACYFYASGTSPAANYSAEFSNDLLQRELEVNERIVRTATTRPSTSPAVVNALFAKLRKALMAKGLTDADFRMLKSDNVDRSRHAQYCRASILFFRGISDLPFQESATVLRSIFASK